MVQNSRLDINISEEDLAEIINAVTTLTEKLAPHLISLTPEERMSLPKMGNTTRSFVNKSLEYTSQYPEFLPSFIDQASFAKDMQVTDILSQLLRSLQPMLSNLSDSHMLSGSEAYQKALIYYRSVQLAAKNSIANAGTIYGDLARRFQRRGKAGSPAANQTEAEPA